MAGISHIPFYKKSHISDWSLLIWALIYAIPVAILFAWKPTIGLIFAAAPIVFLLVNHGPSAIYLLLVSTFLFFPLDIGILLLPADIMAFIVIAAYLVDLLVKGASPRRNRLAEYFALYLGVILLSIIFEGLTILSIRYFFRQLVLISTFLAVSHLGVRTNAKRAMIFFILAAVLNSVYSVRQFLDAGGNIRAFGLAGYGYGDHVMIGFLISSIFYLWTKDIRARIFWAVCALIMIAALAATQTRASVISAGWALVVVLALSLVTAKRIGYRVPKQSLSMAIILGAFIVPLLVLYTPVFGGVVHRFGRMGFEAAGTILLRVSLWKAAIAAFWDNPILGIGAGNFSNIANWVPDVKFDPIFYLVSGLGTHVVILTALAETGLLGFVAMLLFMWRAVKESYRCFTASVELSEIPVTMCLMIIPLVVLGSSFYAGAWFWGNNSYHMAVFFGLMASYRNRPARLILSEPF